MKAESPHYFATVILHPFLKHACPYSGNTPSGA